MESPIDYCLRIILRDLPREILSVVYNVNAYQGLGLRTPITLEKQIENAVIRNQLIPDLMALDGTERTIPLGGLPCRILPDLRVLLEVPTSLTAGRNIMSCQRLNYYYQAGFGVRDTISQGGNVGEINLLANDILDSSSRMPCTSTSKVEVLPGNVLLADVFGLVPTWMSATVTLENDCDLTFISPMAYNRLAMLAKQLTKMMCYNLYTIELDKGRVEFAQEIGRFGDVLNNWSDADRTYYELLNDFRDTMKHEDPEFKDKWTSFIVGGI